MNYTWLLILNNFSGFSYFNISNKYPLKDSKILKIYGLLCTLTVAFHIYNLVLLKEGNLKIYNPNTGTTHEYSSFSRFILYLSIRYFDLCGLLVQIFQYSRRKSINKFFKVLEQFQLKESSRKILRRKCLINSLTIVGYCIVVMFIRNNFIFRRDSLIAFNAWIAEFYIHMILFTSFNFYCNFQQFLELALKDLKDDLQEFKFSEMNLEIVYIKFLKIETFLEHFERNFGFQFTMIVVNFVFSFITFVSTLQDINKYQIKFCIFCRHSTQSNLQDLISIHQSELLISYLCYQLLCRL